jgi:transposase
VVLAGLAKGTLRKKIDQLIPSLTGRFLQRHAFLLRQMLDHVEFIDGQIATIDGEVERACAPFEIPLQLLQSTPGVGSRTAQVIVAEIGCDMNQFPTEHHLASWAAICPGNNESAGKRRTGKTRNGNPWLRAALVEAAWAASRARGTYLQSQFRHLAYARGKGTRKAIVAVAHSILIAAWHILKKNVPYNDLGPEHLRRTNPEKIKRHLVRKLEALGYRVSLEEGTAA